MTDVTRDDSADAPEQAGYLEAFGRSILVSLLATGAGGVVAGLLHRGVVGEASAGIGSVVAFAMLFGGIFHVGFAPHLPGRGWRNGLIFGVAMLLLTATTVQATVGTHPIGVLLPYLAFGVITGVVAAWLDAHLPSGVSWWVGTGYAIAFGGWLLVAALFTVVALDPMSGGFAAKLAIAAAFVLGALRHWRTGEAMRRIALGILAITAALAALPLVLR